MLRVTEFLFNDHILNSPEQYALWMPEDPKAIDEWVKVLVGRKDGEGNWFQVHVCTYNSMYKINKKRYIFPILQWVNVDSLIEEFDKFIANTLPPDLDMDDIHEYSIAMENLGKYWLWEYA